MDIPSAWGVVPAETKTARVPLGELAYWQGLSALTVEFKEILPKYTSNPCAMPGSRAAGSSYNYSSLTRSGIADNDPYMHAPAPLHCSCGYQRTDKEVMPVARYSIWDWMTLLLMTPTPSRVDFVCPRCKFIFESSTDPEIRRKYKFNSA